MSTERQPGWYWVKTVSHDSPEYWECSYYDCNGFHEEGVKVVGPRIPTPDEPWQTVPSRVTPEWRAAMQERGVRTGNIKNIVEDALAAAPTLGNDEEEG